MVGSVQRLGALILEWPRRRVDRVAKLDNRLGIGAVSCGKSTRGFGEVAYLAGVDSRSRVPHVWRWCNRSRAAMASSALGGLRGMAMRTAPEAVGTAKTF